MVALRITIGLTNIVENQYIMSEYVTNYELFKNNCAEFVTYLKECRKSANLTQDDLAEMVESNRININRFENNTENINFELLFKIAEIFGVEITIKRTDS